MEMRFLDEVTECVDQPKTLIPSHPNHTIIREFGTQYSSP